MKPILKINLGTFKSVFVPDEYVTVLLKADKSTNRKTGGLPALYYLRTDVAPHVPVTGGASPVCGTCPFQYEMKNVRKSGMPKCYVDRARSVLSLWRCYTEGGYLHSIDLEGKQKEATVRYFERHRIDTVRMSAYGDPGCVSSMDHWVITQRLKELGLVNMIGYTHAWRKAKHLKPLLMASCFGLAETKQAAKIGWNTFTVFPKDFILHERDKISHPSTSVIMQCRAAVNPDYTCRNCRLCQVRKYQKTLRHISINAH